MRSLSFSYQTKYFPNTLWYISPTKNKNVLKFLRWGSDVLKFSLNWGSAMFLRCSYFFQNLSLDVLINKVLIQSNACTSSISPYPYSGSIHLILTLVVQTSSNYKMVRGFRTPPLALTKLPVQMSWNLACMPLWAKLEDSSRRFLISALEAKKNGDFHVFSPSPSKLENPHFFSF